MTTRNYRSGFTLIELTIVMSIIGVLVAVAIPNFMRYQAKARQSEAKVLLGAIMAREMQYKMETGAFLSCPSNPSAAGKYWDNSVPEWNKIGFSASGALVYQYEAVADEQGVLIKAYGNLDNDDAQDLWTMSSSDLMLVNDQNDVGN